ncbi:hypothetical protein G8C93_11910 [Cellulosimicrobium cellulans]|uniref:hypothetical protein n=1 Tax=Cellulosimicrobium cellulans TaxID=1710 RepID=UPI0018841CD5|nr:hypothetical protein [Cellulosimicrobium cellulans]MBE9926590.1 hypothetical protein [Cellulosimicrobium cellulans]
MSAAPFLDVPTLAGGPGWAADVVAETATPSPSDDPLREDLDPNDVSPGLAGFLAIFAVALATVALFFGLSRQLRRMRHNAETQGIGPDGPVDATAPETTAGSATAGSGPDGSASDGAAPDSSASDGGPHDGRGPAESGPERQG